MAAKSSTAAVKAARAKSWTKAQDRKKAGIEEQALRKLENDEYRKRGEPTPYEQRQREKKNAKLIQKFGPDALTFVPDN